MFFGRRATFYPQGLAYSPVPDDPEKTLVKWLYHLDVHVAFVPTSVVDLIMQKVCRENMMYYRKHAETLRKKRV